ncbi:pre-mRNA-splicing factor 38A [Homalodisca vitripennis]|uniref:pre-mRNA-splicing factor 38A n=1 Tax=Homalodisca vitripennis TaxID=197043 RepID=UPI001EE9EB25|nr:pre-mRNA-splicing factor 38A [Homalodisca vitripennis]KAG8327346.1 Pre-mRNA-splicing factor 38A [Homalodisca vitripennis]
MANRTVKDAKSVKGTNPQYLIEKIIRSRIYDSKYWKEECFALSAELVVDKAMELRYIGGVFGGNIKPTPFLCLTLKMLQIQPEKDIIVEFLKNEDFKYVRALGAFYMRLVGTSLDCYKYLEPLFNDSRKLRRQNRQGQFELVHMDEFIDELLTEERVCDVILPRIQKRHVLEENNEIETKISALDDDLEDGMETSGDEEEVEMEPPKDTYSLTLDTHRSKKREENRRSPTRRGRSADRENAKERDRKHREKERERVKSDRDRGHRMDRERSRSREKERRHRSKTPPVRPSHRDKEREREREKKSRRGDRDQDRGYDRELDRNFERDHDRGYDRDHDRGYDRDYDRGYDRDYDRNHDRDYERDMKRKERDRDRDRVRY